MCSSADRQPHDYTSSYGQGSQGGYKSVTWPKHFQVCDKLKIFSPKYRLKYPLSIMKMVETCKCPIFCNLLKYMARSNITWHRHKEETAQNILKKSVDFLFKAFTAISFSVFFLKNSISKKYVIKTTFKTWIDLAQT